MNISIIAEDDLSEVIDTVSRSDFEDITELITTSNWSAGVFENSKRNLKNFVKADLIALDIDSGCTLEQAQEDFAEYRHIIATTKSHQKDKNGEVCDRFRVVLPLNVSIERASDFKETFKALKKQFPYIDSACSDASRFYYPCVDVVEKQLYGKSVNVSYYVEPEFNKEVTPEYAEIKGVLTKNTLTFLLEGAPAGSRNHALFHATCNMREQGYSEEEVCKRVQDMIDRTGQWASPTLSEKDLSVIHRVFEREMQYEYQANEAQQPIASIVRASSLLSETFTYLRDKNLVYGDESGFEPLDRILKGFRQGEVTVLAAEAKTGKNTFYHFIMHKMLTNGIPIGYASRELTPATEVIPNLMAIELGIDLWEAEITPEIESKVTETVDKYPLYFAEGYGYFPVDKMIEWFTALAEMGVKHFFMDHLHYMLEDPSDSKEAGKVAPVIKKLAKELGIHINLIIQPNKLMEGQKLNINSLKGTSGVGQAMDNLLTLSRKGREHPNVSTLELVFARSKVVKGLTEVDLLYNPTDTTFTEAEFRREADPNTLPPNYVSFTQQEEF